MVEFLEALRDSNITFLRYAFGVGILASISFGIIGSYVVARRITYIAGAIAHCVLGGIGAGLYLQKRYGLDWLDPMFGAFTAALLAALIIGEVSIRASQREDTVIGALWAIGMAVGLLFIAKTPGYVEPMSYLFGNILLISQKDLWMVLGLDALVLVLTELFYNTFLAVCFDEEFARLRGIKTEMYYLLLLCLTALTVVVLIRVVGIVLVIALLTLPAAIAGNFTRALWQMMILAIICCMTFIGTGLALSYVSNLPSGPTIIIIAGAVYLLASFINSRLKKQCVL